MMFSRILLACLVSWAVIAGVVAQAMIDSDVEITCPTYVQPACRSDQEVVSVDVPQQFQRSGCATTMPICKNLAQTASTTPSRQCGANQKFSNESGRCENTNAACQPFMRLCTVGEAPDQLCSCSPTEASVRGPLPCVAALSCPDNRLLNCDATRQTAKRTCFVYVTPTVVSTTPTTPSPTVPLGPAAICMNEYESKIQSLVAALPTNASVHPLYIPDNKRVTINPFKNNRPWWEIIQLTEEEMNINKQQNIVAVMQGRIQIPEMDMLAAQRWYAQWQARCAHLFPGFGMGGEVTPQNISNPGSSEQGSNSM